MIFESCSLDSARVVRLQPHEDQRGHFCRTFCAKEFGDHGLETEMVQTNWSVSRRKNTLRGMHFQVGDSAEAKLMRCTAGEILDVIVDLRRESRTYLQHFQIVLSPDNGRMLYVPRGFAHGFLTLKDDTHVVYQVSNYYSPENERGIRWDDPAIGIDWPAGDFVVSDRDRSHAPFSIDILN